MTSSGPSVPKVHKSRQLIRSLSQQRIKTKMQAYLCFLKQDEYGESHKREEKDEMKFI